MSQDDYLVWIWAHHTEACMPGIAHLAGQPPFWRLLHQQFELHKLLEPLPTLWCVPWQNNRYLQAVFKHDQACLSGFNNFNIQKVQKYLDVEVRVCKFLSLTKDAGCACPWPPTSRSTWEIPWTSRDSTPGIVYKDTAYLLSSVWVRVYIYVVPAIVIDTLSLYPYIYIYLYEPD